MKFSPPILFAAIACVVVLAAIVGGLMVVGTPSEARLHGLDSQRVDALLQLSNAIDQYHSSHKALPSTLERLAAQQGDITPTSMRDPDSGTPYEYRTTGATAYELCARFATPADPDTPIRWRHGRGRTCFDFTAAATASP